MPNELCAMLCDHKSLSVDSMQIIFLPLRYPTISPIFPSSVYLQSSEGRHDDSEDTTDAHSTKSSGTVGGLSRL